MIDARQNDCRIIVSVALKLEKLGIDSFKMVVFNIYRACTHCRKTAEKQNSGKENGNKFFHRFNPLLRKPNASVLYFLA